MTAIIDPVDCKHLDVIVQRNNGEPWLTCMDCMTDFDPAAAVEWWEDAARKHGYSLVCGAPDGYPLHVYGMRKCCPDCSHSMPDYGADSGSTTTPTTAPCWACRGTGETDYPGDRADVCVECRGSGRIDGEAGR